MPTLSRRALPWLAAAALLIPLAGCSSDSGSGTSTSDGAAAADTGDGDGGGGGGSLPDGCTKAIGPTVCFTYDITGSATAKGTVGGTVATGNGTDYETCADWVKGEPDGDDGQPHFFLPQGGPTQPEDDFGGLTGDIIEHYTGPGTYEKKDLSGQGSPSGVILPKSSDSFVLEEDSTGTATVNADGSGKFTFTGMTTGRSDDKAISGTVSWTCHNP